MNKSDCEENALNSRNCSKIVVPKITEKADIFHYTSSMGLKNILHKGSLWFTNIKYMNDASEIINGIRAASRISEMGQENLSETEVIEIEKIIKELERYAIEKTMEKNIFVCCFSRGSDELPLWNYYTKDLMNQGYNIGFSYRKLIASILVNNNILNECEISIGPVIYYNTLKDKYIRGISDNAFIEKEEELKQSMKSFSPNLFSLLGDKINATEEEISELWDMKVNEMFEEKKKKERCFPPIYNFDNEKSKFSQSIKVDPTPYFKREDFQSEKEIRIVITVSNDKLKELKNEGIYKFRINRNILIPYLEIKFDKRAISGITISPTIQSDLIKTSLEEYCEYCEIDPHKLKLGIRNSDIPVRF